VANRSLLGLSHLVNPHKPHGEILREISDNARSPSAHGGIIAKEHDASPTNAFGVSQSLLAQGCQIWLLR